MQKNAEMREKLRQIIRKAGIWAVLLLLFASMVYGANNRIEVTEYTYETSSAPFSFNGFRIVQISDVHNKIFGDQNEPLLDAVRALEPDIIVITGDLIDASTHTDVDAALLLAEQLPKLAPTYYVFGNHEHLLDKSVTEPFLEQIKAYGVRFLNNETVQISSATGQTFSLIGMDDYSLQANILKTIVAEAPDDFCVMLAHEPHFLHDYYAESGVDLVLSGHAHGGQFRIPFTHIGLFTPDEGFFPKYTEGIHTDADTTMIISRGLGNSAFPFRLFNHPEVVGITLNVTD